MDNTRKVTQDSEQDVDKEISVASTLKENTDGGQDDGKNDLADITVGTLLSVIARLRAAVESGGKPYLAVKGMLKVLIGVGFEGLGGNRVSTANRL